MLGEGFPDEMAVALANIKLGLESFAERESNDQRTDLQKRKLIESTTKGAPFETNTASSNNENNTPEKQTNVQSIQHS